MSIAMTTIALFSAIDLFYCAYLAEVMLSNGGSPTAIFWVLLKLLVVAAFIYLAINRNDVDARRINFITYVLVQFLEFLLITIWLVIVWNTFKYGCMFSANCITPLDNCYQCFILVWIFFYVIIGIPWKVLFMFTCYSYYLEAQQDMEAKKV